MALRPLIPFASCLTLTTLVAAQTAAPLPFAVSKETTAITSPLHPDGTPNYVQAVNDRCSRGVTPANNGYVLWLESVVGTDINVMSTTSHDRVLAMSGATDPAPGTPLWLESFQYLQSVEKMSRGRAANEGSRRNTELQSCMDSLWTEAEYPHTAAYLKAMAIPLDHVAPAAASQKWWSPYVTGSHSDTLINTLLPSLGRERSIAYALCARATLRAKSGDFDGFLIDTLTVRRLGRHVATGPTLIERLAAASLETAGCNALGAVAGSGILTADQCQKLKTAMDALPPMPPIVDSVDTMERWNHLEILEHVARNDQTLLQEVDLLPLAQSVDRTAVDWNIVLRTANTHIDEEVTLFHTQPLPDRQSAIQSFDKDCEERAALAANKPAPPLQPGPTESDAAFDQRVRAEADLKVLQTVAPGESRDTYSHRVADAFAGKLWPSLGKADELTSAAIFRSQALQVVLAAAQYKAASNKWPATLADLLPTYLKDIPHDPYDPATEVHYLVTDKGVRVYSVGPNGSDDGGIDNRKLGADDLGSGPVDAAVP